MNELPRLFAEVAPRLVRRLGEARDTDEALRALLEDVIAATGVDAGAVYRWEVEPALLIRVSATTPPPDFEGTVRPGQGPIGEAAELRVPRVLAGVAGASPADDADRWGLRSVVAVPLVHADQLAGAVVIGRRSGDAFGDASGDEDLGVLAALAALACPVLALAEAAGQARALQRRVESLTQAARELAHDLNNDLTMPIGALELIRERADLPADARELIEAAADDLTKVEARVRAFQQVARGDR